MPLPISAQVAAGLPGVIEGLVSSTLYSLLGQISKGRFPQVREDFQSRVRGAISSADLTSITGFGPIADGSAEQLRSFLSSPECGAVLSQIYSSRLTDGKNGLDSIESEFSKLLMSHVPGSDERLAVGLFKIVLSAADSALTAAVDRGSIGALDAKQQFRTQILLDQLSAVSKNLELLASKPDVHGIVAFEESYRSQVASRHDSIQPPHLDRQKKYPIDALYVAPNLSRYFSEGTEWRLRPHNLMPIQQLLSTLYRAVLLGNPGAGKSTFALKLCHDLSTSGKLAGRRVTPILVVLRDYGAQKKEHNSSIMQFIEARSAAWYQVTPPPKAFEYLLLNGRGIVIFDGLDELLETSYRREIGDDIEAFANLYPSVPVVVTSRVVGYEQAPLDVRKFITYRLADFEDAQVQEYARKWFRTDETSTSEQQGKRAEAFVKESHSVPDLRSNPLMLALMCNIYLGEDFIPTNRPDVYKKCALMLFDRWDRSRRIHTGYGFENQLSPIMTHIAHWLYSNPGLQSGVTELKLIQECAKYLYPRRYEHFEEAEKASTEFIEFCRGRAWVFSDTGTTPAGESLYQFTHRTFLEYFTALYLFRTNPKPSDLLAVLRPRISKREWDVVAQLAFHITGREVEGGGDELMMGLLSAAESKPSDRLNYLTFAGRCMEFISCSPKVSRNVAIATLATYAEVCTKMYEARKARKARPPMLGMPAEQEMLANLLHTGMDNRNTVAETIERVLTEDINKRDPKVAVCAAETAITLTLFLHRPFDGGQENSEIAEYWHPIHERILQSNSKPLREIFRQNASVASAAQFMRVLSLTDLASWHGIKAVFKSTPSTIGIDSWAAVGHSCLFHAVRANDNATMQALLLREIRPLAEIGMLLRKSHVPWSGKPDFTGRFADWITELRPSSPLAEAPTLPPDALFGAFALAAAALEAIENTKQCDLLQSRIAHNGVRLASLAPLRKLLFSRIEGIASKDLDAELARLGSAIDGVDLIRAWATRQVNFVRHHGKKVRTNKGPLTPLDKSETAQDV